MVLAFEENKAHVRFTPEEGLSASGFKIHVYAKDSSKNSNSLLVYTSKKHPLKAGLNKWSILIDYVFYAKVAKKLVVAGKPLPNSIDFSFKIHINDEKSDVANTISVHFVRYIPKLLNKLGFTNAEKLQRIWFTKGNNTNKDNVNPEIDVVSFNWAINESSQVKTEYNDFLNETGSKLNNNLFFSNPIRDALKSEINKMIKDGLLTLPTKSNPSKPFGVTNASIINYRGQRIPQFEKYYFNSKPFSGFGDLGLHYIFDGLDDFIAALANFNYHMFATGSLEYEENKWSSNVISIKVKQLAVYIKDSFDFIDDDSSKSQPLGYWKVNNDKSIEVERKTSDKSNYFEVTNQSYRAYREAHNMGYNFYVYSTIRTQATNYSVKLKDI